MKSLFLKKFDLKALKEVKGNAKITQLKAILAWTKTLHSSFLSLTDQVKYEILYKGMKSKSFCDKNIILIVNILIIDNSFDTELFSEYIRDPKSIIPEMNKQSIREFKESKKKYDSFWESIHNFSSKKYS